MHSALFGNAEALRTQSCCLYISSAISASPRFKNSLTEIAEHGYVLTPGRSACAEKGGGLDPRVSHSIRVAGTASSTFGEPLRTQLSQ